MAPRVKWMFDLVLVCWLALWANGQILNRAPQFLPGGDMARFSLPEDTPPGAPIYKLLGSDPEESTVHFSISGEYFTVDKYSGVVTLLRAIDREKVDLIEVIISITDEGVDGAEPNTVSLRRVIPILDINDNPPVFLDRPYAFRVAENARVGSTLYSNITVTDEDLGNNADVTLECADALGDACQTFAVSTEKLSEGRYVGIISLQQPLDYETNTGYSLVLKAVDQASDVTRRLSATANVIVDVLDVQDQPPVFLNAPYSATIAEETKPGTSILTVRARDGDLGDPRPILLTLEDDSLGYFTLVTRQQDAVTYADLLTSDAPLDREHPDILESGGIYTFKIKATELINNELPGDVTTSVVTIVITDVDDQLPTFNQESFQISVSEDIGLDTPLPGLQMVVNDPDVGDNARFTLKLRDVQNSENTFTVHPSSGVGRTPVVIRVTKPLDYDVEDDKLREIIFDVVAYVKNTEGIDTEVASSRVTVNVLDANDNSPIFPFLSQRVRVREDIPPGTMISNISAVDVDSGDYGVVKYAIKGFGSEKFSTDPKEGGIFVAKKSMGIDFEMQKSYSLTFEGKDGGGRVTTVNLFVEIEDVNDNAPKFEHREYTRTVREGATTFQPQLFVRATDMDSGDGGRLFYSLESSNADQVLFVEPVSGEIKLNRPATAMDTPRGQYELVVRATDAGVPPLHNETRVTIRVGVTGNQRPIFRAFNDRPHGYKALVPEDASAGHEVVKVEATDPDGQDHLITYHIASGDKDNFDIDEKSGQITVSPDARLDLESSGHHYDVIVHAVDAGTPYRETAMATISIEVKDVNNKPPVFPANETYVRYISERVKIGESILAVQATDPDKDSKIVYSIVDPIKAFDKTGATLTSSPFDFKKAFKINETTGEIKTMQILNHNQFSIVILTIQAKDVNATDTEQVAKVEVTIYIQAFDEQNPIFLGHDWTPTDPTIRIKVPEELPLQTTLLILEARDPLSGEMIRNYEIVRSTMLHEFDGFLSMEGSGNIVLNRRLDFESLKNKVITLKVRALSDDRTRSTESAIEISVEDINDNTPEFVQKSYSAKVLESARYPVVLLTVKATDKDANSSSTGFGTLVYSLSGEHSNLFMINKDTGMIQVAPNATLDREKQSLLRFNVVATDLPQGGTAQRKTTAPVTVDVLDVNDNAPQFSKAMYSAVVPETVPKGSSVASVLAHDPDEGIGGDIVYEIFDEGESKGMFTMNSSSGLITTKKALTGKGRTDPYELVIRAQDKGLPSMNNDVPFRVYIGDVFSNDGVPMFIRPQLNEVAKAMEDASVGTPVFQVIASDPDDPASDNGRIVYSFLEDGINSNAFNIDTESGLITTSRLLDRETKDKYTLLVMIQDQGEVPQQATRELHIQVEDVDDHKPIFKRSLDEEPIALSVKEEVEIGTKIGTIEAKDEDIGENGKIDYLITSGNEDGLFNISRTEDNKGMITVTRRLDREVNSEHLLTVKCFKMADKPTSLRKAYNRQDPSERQVRIKVEDIDDNPPYFKNNNITIGVRLNVPIDTQLLTLEADDLDVDAEPITFQLLNTTFFPLAASITDAAPLANKSSVFRLDGSTGELRTASAMLDYADGYFEMRVSANNSRAANSTIKMFVLRDRDLLKFVFGRPPADVRRVLDNFREEVQRALLLPAALNVYDTQIHSKKDGSLDFSSTSSCFQLVGKESYDLSEMEALLQDPNNSELLRIYNKYNVQGIQRCSPQIAKAKTSWTQILVLVVAAFIGFAAFIATITTCCLYGRYKRQSRRAEIAKESPRILGFLPPTGGGPPTIIMSPPPSEGPQMYDWSVENLSNYHTHSTRSNR